MAIIEIEVPVYILVFYPYKVLFNSILQCSISLCYRGRKKFVSKGDEGSVKDSEY